MEKALTPLQSLKSETKLRDYLAIFARRKLVIIVALLSVVGSTFMYVSRIKDIYQSFSTIVIEEKNFAINPLFHQMPEA